MTLVAQHKEDLKKKKQKRRKKKREDKAEVCERSKCQRLIVVRFLYEQVHLVQTSSADNEHVTQLLT